MAIKHMLRQFILTQGDYSVNVSACTRQFAIETFNRLNSMHKETDTVDFSNINIEMGRMTLQLGDTTVSTDAE